MATCVECLKQFTSTTKHAKYCDEKCERAHQRRQSLIWRQTPEAKEVIMRYRQEAKKNGRRYKTRFEEDNRKYNEYLRTMPPEDLVKHVKRLMEREKQLFHPEMINRKPGKPIVFVVGERPGKREHASASTPVWAESKSGRVMRVIVGNIPNVYLTNIVNSWQEDQLTFLDHFKRLQDDIKKHKPKKILCFGEFSYRHVKKMKVGKAVIEKFEHPSYVLRFKTKEIEKYIEEVRQSLLASF